MTTAIREKVYDFVCAFFDDKGYSPSVYEIGEHFGFSPVAAWKHVKTLVEEGRLARPKGRYRGLVIPGRIDLRPVTTVALLAELRRRGSPSTVEALQS